ncbi:MAG: hypothetical protein ACOY3X_06340 [Pseudomonadota bacterium]
MSALLQPALVALLVGGSLWYVLSRTVRSVRAMSRSRATGCGGCNACGGCPTEES